MVHFELDLFCATFLPISGNLKMSLTATMKDKLIILLLLAIALVFSRSALAQVDVIKDSPPAANGDCRMNECEATDSSLSLQIRDLWNPAELAFIHSNGSPHRSFYLKNESAEEWNLGYRSLKYTSHTSVDQFPISQKSLEGSSYSPIERDSPRRNEKSFGAKLLRASLMTYSAQMANLLSMIAFPDKFNYSCSSWAEAKSNLHRAWTSPPVWDKDPWMTNLIGHPYVGGFYYNMLRSQGISARSSFLYSTGQSLIWEFVIEAVAEQPSIQDLIFTSNLGSIVGELSHRATIQMGKNGFSTFEKILVMVINPVYVFNNGFKKHPLPLQ